MKVVIKHYEAPLIFTKFKKRPNKAVNGEAVVIITLSLNKSYIMGFIIEGSVLI